VITIPQVIATVDEIRFHARGGDDERAHNAEDTLYGEVLATIASGKLTAAEAAALALEASMAASVEFSRYTA
jgi:hypothetical protein